MSESVQARLARLETSMGHVERGVEEINAEMKGLRTSVRTMMFGVLTMVVGGLILAAIFGSRGA